MSRMEKIDPVIHGRVNYIMMSRKKPFSLNAGKIKEIRSDLANDKLVVDFMITKKEAKECDRWDGNNERVMIQLLDADNMPLHEMWLDLSTKHIVKSSLIIGD